MMIMNTNTNTNTPSRTQTVTMERSGLGRDRDLSQSQSRNQSPLQGGDGDARPEPPKGGTALLGTGGRNTLKREQRTEEAGRSARAPLMQGRGSLQPKCPVGVMEGRLCGWVDLGTQRVRFGSGAAAGAADAGAGKGLRKVMLTFCVRGAAGESWRVSREFTLSGGPRSALRALLEAWRGQPYASDEEAWQAVRKPLRVLERQGLVRISERAGKDGRLWPQVEGVWPMLKGAQALPLRWPPVYFTLEALCRETFQGLLPWVQAKVRASEEWGRLAAK